MDGSHQRYNIFVNEFNQLLPKIDNGTMTSLERVQLMIHFYQAFPIGPDHITANYLATLIDRIELIIQQIDTYMIDNRLSFIRDRYYDYILLGLQNHDINIMSSTTSQNSTL
jgi:hypothetical protein